MKRRMLPKYVTQYKDRHGKMRFRFRKGDFKCSIKNKPWTPEFMVEYQACLDGDHDKVEASSSKAIPGSFSDLIERYYTSSGFKAPKPQTRHKTRLTLERFRAAHGDRLVRDVRSEHLDRIFADMSDTPNAANNLRKILKRLLQFARMVGMRADNPVELTTPYKVKTAGFHSWTDEEIAQFERRHPIGTKARLALALMLFTGQRRSDAVMMGRQHVDAGTIRVVQVKTDHRLQIPIHWELKAVIDATPNDHLTFLVTEYGKPFSAAGFGNWFRERCDQAGLPHCTAHGLRKAQGRRMAEAGCTAHQIMAVLGVGLKEATIYTAAADQKQLAADGMSRLTASQLANREAELDKNGAKPLKGGE